MDVVSSLSTVSLLSTVLLLLTQWWGGGAKGDMSIKRCAV